MIKETNLVIGVDALVTVGGVVIVTVVVGAVEVVVVEVEVVISSAFN